MTMRCSFRPVPAVSGRVPRGGPRLLRSVPTRDPAGRDGGASTDAEARPDAGGGATLIARDADIRGAA